MPIHAEKIERTDELPQGLPGERGDFPLWEAVLEALEEGYKGWIKATAGSRREATALVGKLRYHAKQENVTITIRQRELPDDKVAVFVKAKAKVRA